MIKLKSEKQIEIMYLSGQITKRALALIEQNIKPGISTLELDKIAEDYIRSQNATPSFKNYDGFPGSICTSVNDVVVHGIPSKKVILKEGDIISIDIGACYRGWHSDAARTYPVGVISPEKQQLIEVTKQCFYQGLKQLKVGVKLGDVCYAIGQYAESFGYGVVKELVGHGVGKDIHEDPSVPNYGYKGFGITVESGLVIAIEPMINMGTEEITIDSDGWTIRTLDRKPSAHYENTVAVLDDKIIILTD